MDIFFKEGDIVRHVKTGGMYKICLLPNDCMIEKTWEPGYGYRSTEHTPTPIVIRSQAEMEDGRFELVSAK